MNLSFPRTRSLKLATLACAASWVVMAMPASAPEKTIFAHYMGCYPIGYGPIDYSRKNLWKEMKHDSSDFLAAIGGRIVNWPLLPQGRTLTPEQSAELEIQRAMRAGIDGFAIDAWAGDDQAKATLDQLFAAAERMKARFLSRSASIRRATRRPPQATMSTPTRIRSRG